MRTLITTFVLLIFSFTLFGQSYQPSLIFDDEAYDQVPHQPRYTGEKYNNVPLSVSLREFTPYPGDQGFVGSCVGFATGYGAYTISKAIKLNIRDRKLITYHAHSASYIYNLIKEPGEPCETGSKITDALSLLANRGVCTTNAFPNLPEDCEKKPTGAAFDEARHFTIKDYAAIFSYADEARVKIDKTIKSIADRKPVIIGILATTSFLQIGAGQTKWMPAANEPVVGGHAMVVVGYDYPTRTFEVMNSFGKEWADEGFIRISFDDFGRLVKYGFQILMQDDITFEPPVQVLVEDVATIELSGDFVFRFPTGYAADNKVQFEEAAASFNTNRQVYELVRKDWRVNDVFQLVARNVPEGENVYVFSINPNDKLEIHWPLNNGQYDAMRNVPLSHYVPSENCEIVVPGEDMALQLEAPGEDYLCILYSSQRIEDYQQRLEKVRTATGSMQQRLATGFGDLLIANDKVEYGMNQMTFSSSSPKNKGSVVPILLSVTAQ